MISIHFQGKPFNITIIQVYAPISNAEEAEVEWFYEDLQDLLELTPKKDVLFMKVKSESEATQLGSAGRGSPRPEQPLGFCILVPYHEKDIFFGC